jgi:hypothetical protein
MTTVVIREMLEAALEVQTILIYNGLQSISLDHTDSYGNGSILIDARRRPIELAIMVSTVDL